MLFGAYIVTESDLPEGAPGFVFLLRLRGRENIGLSFIIRLFA